MKTDIGYWLGEAEHLLVNGWRWRKARTFADLLAGNIDDLIRHRDEEADQVTDGDPAYWQRLTTEITLNRCGVFTEHSVGGGHRTYARLEYRAALTCLVADDAVLSWLTDLAHQLGAGIRSHTLHVPAPGDTETRAERLQRTGVATIRGLETGKEYLHVGGASTRRELFREYPVHPAAGRELRAARQVTIYDPQWGDSDLFTNLLTAALDRQQHTSKA